jgi:hypothetical protein
MSVRAHESLEYEPRTLRDAPAPAPVPRPHRRRGAVHLRFAAWVVALVAAISFVGSALAGPLTGHDHRPPSVTRSESGRK